MIYYETELYHHGVKGMKWGVRRYQNKDGSLTSEGRRREALDNKSKELFKKAEKDANKNPAHRQMMKMYNDWKKKYPDSDDDDFGDYLVDNPKLQDKYEALEKQSYMNTHYDAARRAHSDAVMIKSDYVKGQTSATAAVAAFTAAPLTAFATNKVLKAAHVEGKKRAIASLGAGLGSIGFFTLHSYVTSKKEHNRVAAKYGLGKE